MCRLKGAAKHANQKDFAVTSREDFILYTSTILSDKIIARFIANMAPKADIIEQKYCITNWNAHLKTL